MGRRWVGGLMLLLRRGCLFLGVSWFDGWVVGLGVVDAARLLCLGMKAFHLVLLICISDCDVKV
jgi:hypothetical protein